MKPFYETITLINESYMILAQRNIIGGEIKCVSIDMALDKESLQLYINEEIQQQMQFPIIDRRKVKVAENSIIECDVAGNVKVKYKNYSTTCTAFILPGCCKPVIGIARFDDKPAKVPYLKLL